MAKRTQVITVDDLDGEEISNGAKTVTFAHGGTTYEIDLTEKNARKFHDVLAPYISAARRVSTRRSPGSATAPTDKSQLRAMRVWAKDHGFNISERGRVSQEVQDAYHAAH